MKTALLLSCLVGVVSCSRTINWYITIDGPNATQNEVNAAAVKEHLPLFSQLQLAWRPGMPETGSLAGWDNEAAVNTWLDIYKPLNIPIIPVVVNMVNGTTMHTMYKDPTGYGKQLVAIGKKYGFAGFNFDYEPQHPRDHDAKAYADFLKTVNDILVAEGFTLSVWVASWSEALKKFGVLAESGIQYLQDMSTYGGWPMVDERDYVDEYVREIRDATGSAAQAGVGMGPYHTEYWTEENTRKFISHAVSKGVTNIDIFRLLMDGSNNWPAPFWYTVLGDFITGKI